MNVFFFFFKQKTAYEIKECDWSSDVCSSDLGCDKMALKDTTFKKLESIVGKQYCTRKKEDLLCYAYDATARSYLPCAVLFPRDAREISTILHLADRKSVV